jgi:RNA polymerase sigma factor (sigma-70 family)
MTAPEAEELLTANLGVIDRAIGFACRRHRLEPADADDFAAVVKLKLVDDDYAVLRAYEQRSSFATYISIVVQRAALDFRTHAWGKWHASAEAKRLGSVAVELEQLVHRDGRTLDEALTILAPRHEGVTRVSLQATCDALPQRAPRRREVDLDQAMATAASLGAEDAVVERERRSESERVSALMTELLDALPGDDRLFLQLRFEGAMTVAQIARSFGIEQKLLYRRMDRCMRELRDQLTDAGVEARGISDLIGRSETFLDFKLGNAAPRPSIPGDESAAAETGGSP